MRDFYIFYKACSESNLEKAKKIVDSVQDVQHTFNQAVLEGSLIMAEYMIEKGADPTEESSLKLLVKKDNIEIMRIVLERYQLSLYHKDMILSETIKNGAAKILKYLEQKKLVA